MEDQYQTLVDLLKLAKGGLYITIGILKDSCRFLWDSCEILVGWYRIQIGSLKSSMNFLKHSCRLLRIALRFLLIPTGLPPSGLL